MEENKPCPLLDLPPELRNHIYEYLLIEHDDDEIDANNVVRIHYDSEIRPSWESPPILATCRQIRHEASSVYFGDNIFRVSLDSWNITQPLHPWLKALSPVIRPMLRKVQLDLDYPSRAKARTCLDFFREGLEEIECELREDALAVQVLIDETAWYGQRVMYGGEEMYNGQDRRSFVWTNGV